MNKYLIIIACMMSFYSCSEENNRLPVTDDPTIPGKVSNIRVEELPGAVKLTYDLPRGQSLSYVKAECLINGVLRQVKASAYVNHLTIEGFADNSLYTINLYSVNRSEKASEPVPVQAQPLAPPFQEVYKSLQLIEDWSGAAVFFENPSEADLAICLIHVDSTSFWNQGETFYTKRQQGSFSVRGFKPVETKFGVYIRDRWNNTTDTMVKVLTPRFDKPLDRTKFRAVSLPSDVPAAWGWVMTNLWNGNTGEPGFHTNTDGIWPHWFTFDLGTEEGALLSRCIFWQRIGSNNAYSFTDRNIKKFEIWGSMDPNPNGTFDESWTLLLDGEYIKPSGLPAGQFTEDDLDLLVNGHEFVFPLAIPYVRYIRVKVKETWSGAKEFFITQVAFWGSEPSDNPLEDE